MYPQRFAVMLAALALVLGFSAYRNAQAVESQAEVASLCAQIPGLLAAVDYTTTTYPSPDPSAPSATVDPDVAFNLAYFADAVANDGRWCAANGQKLHYDMARNTMSWHFGNASEYLLRYQSLAGVPGAPMLPQPTTPPAVSTPTPPAQPIATPIAPTQTPTPPATATPTASSPTPAAPQPTATRHPDSKLEFARLLVRDSPSPCETSRGVRPSQSVVKQGRFWTLVEWKGEGIIFVKLLKDGETHRVQPTRSVWNLEPFATCQQIGLFDDLPAIMWELNFEPGNYTLEVYHFGARISTTSFQMVP